MSGLVYQGTLFIGLGGTGGRVLKELRKRIYEEFGKIPAGLGFMYIDSSTELMHQDDPTWRTTNGYDAQFPPEDFLNIGRISGKSIHDHLNSFPTLKGIAENCIHLEGHQGGFVINQDRRLGRVLLGANGIAFSNMLRDHVNALRIETGYSDIHVHIITGLSGGTGSGAVVSVIAHILRMYPEAKVSLYATLPVVPFPYDCGRSLANTYAALRELNALNVGRLKVTDLVTGEQWQPEMPYDNSLNYCHHLQENKLFRLFLFDNFFREYDKVSDILYHNLSLDKSDDNIRSYLRYLDMYSVTSEPEFDATTPEGEDLVYARTNAVGALGLCRIVYPRKQILQSLAYSATSQAIWQMLYNNYRKDFGFVREAAEFDPRAVLKHNIKNWHLDYESMTLQRPVLTEDRESRPFIYEWEGRLEIYSYKDAKTRANEQQNAFAFLADYAQYVYREDFHQHSGVETYFDHKRHAVAEYAKEINDTIEEQLFSSWLTGEYGLCQLRQIYEALEAELKEFSTAFTKQAEELRLYVADEEKCINLMLEEVGGMSKIQIRMKELAGWMQKRYSDFKKCLASYYSGRTGLVSLEFAQDLTRKLLQEINDTEDNLAACIDVLQRIDEHAIGKDDLLTFNKPSDLKRGVIYIDKRQEVEHYKEFMCADRVFIERLAAQVRTKFADDTEQSFSLLSKKREYREIADSSLQSLMEAITEYDDTNFMFSAIQEFPTNEHLSTVVKQTIEVAYEQVKLNDKEITRAVRNNPSLGAPKPAEIISIRIPQAATMEEKSVSEKVKDLYLANIPKAQVEVEIDSMSPNPDEISIASVRTNFPLRFIDCLPTLKRQYDQLMADERLQAKYMLHTEDSFTDLPSLEVETLIN